MASFFRMAARRSSVAAATAFAVPYSSPTGCESSSGHEQPKHKHKAGMHSDAQGDFHGLFPKRQLWQPKLEYPLWDENWDGRKPHSTGDKEEDHRRKRMLRKEGVTRHIILIRHGQYDETHREDERRVLTPLGREQANETGKRIAELIKGDHGPFTPCNVKLVNVSCLARAKETADIIAKHLPGVQRGEPDPDLNEGRPCHTIPGGRAHPSTIEKTDEQHPRIEAAYQKYFYRAPEPTCMQAEEEKSSSSGDSSDAGNDADKHEYEIYVCHANVIRYFFCRALQLPPEAWLRLCTFNCSLTYLTIRPTGTVSCRMLGDIGHLPYHMTSFSGHHGFNW